MLSLSIIATGLNFQFFQFFQLLPEGEVFFFKVYHEEEKFI